MKLDTVIVSKSNKTVYRDGDRCIKVFHSEFSKADVLNEALNQARIEQTGLNVPKVSSSPNCNATTSACSAFVSDMRGYPLQHSSSA